MSVASSAVEPEARSGRAHGDDAWPPVEPPPADDGSNLDQPVSKKLAGAGLWLGISYAISMLGLLLARFVVDPASAAWPWVGRGLAVGSVPLLASGLYWRVRSVVHTPEAGSLAGDFWDDIRGRPRRGG
jgi:hypothetical protein